MLFQEMREDESNQFLGQLTDEYKAMIDKMLEEERDPTIEYIPFEKIEEQFKPKSDR